MFVPDVEADFNALLQGDVVADVPVVATLELDKISLIGPQAWAHAAPLKNMHCVVLSHSCEIAPENGEKVTSCILAPLRKADGATTPELTSVLQQNALGPGTKTFFKYFYIPPIEKLPNANGSVVDFSKLFSLRKTAIGVLTERKILEMTQDGRRLLGRKLGAYFFRGAE